MLADFPEETKADVHPDGRKRGDELSANGDLKLVGTAESDGSAAASKRVASHRITCHLSLRFVDEESNFGTFVTITIHTNIQ